MEITYQLDLITWLAHLVFSTISASSSSLVIATYFMNKQLRNLISVFVVNLCASILICRVFTIMPNHTDTLCALQVFVTTVFDLAVFVWPACMAYFIYLSVTMSETIEKKQKNLGRLFFLLCYGLPFLLATVYFNNKSYLHRIV